jgi:DNA-binding MarR family transcriptional regulator
VRLTRAGRETVDAALSDLLAHEHELLGELTPQEQTTLAGMLRRLNAPLEP